MNRRSRPNGIGTIDVANYIAIGATFTLGCLYLTMWLWLAGTVSIAFAIAAFAWHEWRRARDRAEACGARVHRDFADGEDIRCQLPAGHAAHRNGEREWTP